MRNIYYEKKIILLIMFEKNGPKMCQALPEIDVCARLWLQSL